jgi:triosephosphate isomerase
MILLNLKNYEQGIREPARYIKAAKEVCEESGVRIAVALPAVLLKDGKKIYSDVFAQHADPFEPGASTGAVIPFALKAIGVRGSMINHSEKRVGVEKAKETVVLMKKYGLESVVCVEKVEEGKEVAKVKPEFIAIEPPELIGSGRSISKYRPELIENAVREIDGTVLAGAGVSTKEDVEVALKLGAKGVLLASAFVKAENPNEFLRGFASVF